MFFTFTCFRYDAAASTREKSFQFFLPRSFYFLCKSLRNIMTGTFTLNLSLSPGNNTKILRAPGASGLFPEITKIFAKIRLKSGQSRWFDVRSIATGQKPYFTQQKPVTRYTFMYSSLLYCMSIPPLSVCHSVIYDVLRSPYQFLSPVLPALPTRFLVSSAHPSIQF